MRFLTKIRAFLLKALQEFKYYRMDRNYYHSLYFHCWDLFPPSFYARYSPEEQKRITDSEIAKLRAMVEQYCKENGIETHINDSVQRKNTKET